MSATFQRRIIGLMYLFLAIAGFFTLRLGWLQLVQGRELAILATAYHTRAVYYRFGHGSEGRGTIFDRRLRPLTEGNLQPGLAVFATVGNNEEEYGRWLEILSNHTGLTPEEIVQRSRLRRPLPLKMPLPAGLELPHWIVPVEGDWDADGAFRRYTYGRNFACHVLGFVKTHSRAEGAEGLVVGQMGIEKAFDSHLRCPRPGVAAMVDAGDRLIGGLGYRHTFPVDRMPYVVLSLDAEIQGIVEETLDDYIQRGLVPPCGAVVVMDPHTGDILAMASRPVISGEKNHYNRATRKSDKVAMLPLASVAKLITAAAALEKDPALYHQWHDCPGSGEFNCVFGPHGQQDMARALANSCNTYFAELAAQVGARELLAMAKALGLGQKKDIGLPGWEVGAGSLPELPDLATRAGLANHFAMGGNKLEATPLQVAAMLSAIANGGWYVEPRLVLATGRGEIAEVTAPPPKRERVMSPTTAQLLARMMHLSVREGSAGHFDHAAYPYAAAQLAAKTGTSDAGLPPYGYQVRWNAGFFPWRNPRYVVVYMAEVPPGFSGVRREQIVAELVCKLAAQY